MGENINMYNTITKEQKMLLGLLSKTLFSAPFVMDEDINWAELYKESRQQTVVLSAFDGVVTLPYRTRRSAES